MNWDNVIDKLSSTSFHITLVITLTSLTRVFLTQWFMVKLAKAKTSKVIVRGNDKTASFSQPVDGERVIEIFKNADQIDAENFFDQAS